MTTWTRRSQLTSRCRRRAARKPTARAEALARGSRLIDRDVGQTVSSMIRLLATEFDPPGRLVESSAHEYAAGAVVHRYSVPEGAVLVTVWRGLIHEVIYQTPCETDQQSDARNQRLFAHYGEGQEWSEILDNGFGKTYRRADLERYALWSYVMDFTTFGTMAFHQVKWR